MYLRFDLSMPVASSWNGQWSGDGNPHYRIICLRGKRGAEKGKTLLFASPYSYHFGDGWVAEINVRELDAKTARKLRKIPTNFGGYDWMLTSILACGKIATPT